MDIRIIPAIDIIGGKCVRLCQGDYAQCTTYSSSPLDVAMQFEDCGVKLLHLVDLDGAKESAPKNLRILEEIAGKTTLNVEFGGGIKAESSLKSAFDAGAYRVICGSTACNEPLSFVEWLEKYGGEKLVFGADLKNGIPAVRGWLESGKCGIEELLRLFLQHGLRTSIITDIACDGMLKGPSVQLYKKLGDMFPNLDIIASGGIGNMGDILKLEDIKIKEVIVGKAIYEGRISLKELKNHILGNDQ